MSYQVNLNNEEQIKRFSKPLSYSKKEKSNTPGWIKEKAASAAMEIVSSPSKRMDIAILICLVIFLAIVGAVSSVKFLFLHPIYAAVIGALIVGKIIYSKLKK